MEHSPFWAAAALAEFVRDQASWRRTQTQRFPDDARNAQSADALEQLAMHVEALPDTDRHLIELVELDAFDDASHFTADEEARRAIARWGFGDATSHMRPRDLLQDLVAITRRARRVPTPAHERNTKMTSSTMPAVEPIAKHELSETERYVMYDLFTLAAETSRECQDTEQALRDAIAADPTNYSDQLGEYVTALTKLHAAIAPAALARVPILAPISRSDGSRIELLDPGRERDLERFLRPIFEDAGIGGEFAGIEHQVPTIERDVLMTLEERRELAVPLRAVRDRIEAFGAGNEPKTHRAIEMDLIKARDLAQRVPAAVARIDDATQQVRVLAHTDAIADQHLHHEAVNRVKNAMDTILENLVPEDVLDGEPSWNRRRVLQDVIVEANTGDVWAIDVLKARPHLAWFDETSKKWFEQVDSGRGPGIAVSRDRVIRMPPPSK